ncbi:MAG: FtsQ-type POTRA domain-containing protein [Alphaproteobacteria bacterium]
MRRVTRIHTAARRQRRPKFTLAGTLRVLGTVLLGMAIVGGPIWLWRSRAIVVVGDKAKNALIATTGILGMQIDTVGVEGINHTDRETILTTLGARKGAPLLGIDLKEAKMRLEQLPWVGKATIERRLPDRLYVSVIERTPAALWQHGGHFDLVDAEGIVIPNADTARYPMLPQVIGPDAPQHVRDLMVVLMRQPDLAAKVLVATRLGERRWDIRLDNGVDVYLPAQGVAEAWERLAHLQEQSRLLDRDIIGIDLRVPNRVVIKLAPNSAQKLGLVSKGS